MYMCFGGTGGSPSTTWTLEVKLRSSGLAIWQEPLPTKPPHQPPKQDECKTNQPIPQEPGFPYCLSSVLYCHGGISRDTVLIHHFSSQGTSASSPSKPQSHIHRARFVVWPSLPENSEMCFNIPEPICLVFETSFRSKHWLFKCQDGGVHT